MLSKKMQLSKGILNITKTLKHDNLSFFGYKSFHKIKFHKKVMYTYVFLILIIFSQNFFLGRVKYTYHQIQNQKWLFKF